MESSNISSSDIDGDTATKLRGDAIGNTMYSERFILKALIQLADLCWTPETEDDLCFLWDMTQEPDVCEYLFKASFPALACNAIIKYDENRFIEIMVGILANLLSSTCEKPIAEDEVQVVLNLLSSDDPLILIQVVRFIHALTFVIDSLAFITDDILSKITFILLNSTNEELLSHTLKTVVVLTQDLKLNDGLLHGNLLLGSVAAHQVITKDCFKLKDGDFEMDLGEPQFLAAKYLLQIACNLCIYVDEKNCDRLKNDLNDHVNVFLDEVNKLLYYFRFKENLVCTSEMLEFYIEALLYVLKTLTFDVTTSLIISVCTILHVVQTEKLTEGSVTELFCYLMSLLQVDNFKEEAHKLPMPIFTKVADHIQRSNCRFDFEYCSNLERVLSLVTQDQFADNT